MVPFIFGAYGLFFAKNVGQHVRMFLKKILLLDSVLIFYLYKYYRKIT